MMNALEERSPKTPYRAAARAALRCGLGLVLTLGLAGCREPVEATVSTPEDLAILDGARALLDGGARWQPSGDRSCTLDQERWNLFCALWQSSRDVLGTYQHRRAALEAARWAIEEVSQRDWPHRLQDFNNAATTTFDDIAEVLARAAERVRSQLPPAAADQPIHMVRQTLVELHRGQPSPPPSDAAASEARAGHFAHLGDLERRGRLIVAGPVEEHGDGGGDGDGLVGYLILRTGDPRQAAELASQDPAIRAGLLRPVVRTVWLPAGLGWPNPRYADPAP